MNLLGALQWADTAFPSGRYTLSHGLEGLLAAGVVEKRDAVGLARVAEDMLRYAFAPVDLVAHFHAWEATEIAQLTNIDGLVHACRPTFAQRRGSTRVGRQMLLMASNLSLSDDLLDHYRAAVSSQRPEFHHAHGHSCVVMSLIHRQLGLSAEEAAQVESYGFIAAVTSAAVRLQLLDYIEAQQVNQHLSDCVAEVIAGARAMPLSDIGACTPLLDIAAARHETAPARLFIT